MNCATLGLEAYVPSVDQPWDEGRVQHLYRRAGFGATPSEIEQALADGPALTVQRLLSEAAAAGKMIASYGNGLAALARAGVIKGKRVTGDPSCADAARKAGGKYTGRQLEVAGQVITALDESSGMRFGKALAQVVGI